MFKAHSSILKAKSDKYQILFLCIHESSLSRVDFFPKIAQKLAFLYSLLLGKSGPLLKGLIYMIA